MAQLQAKEAEGWDEYKRYCFCAGVRSENNPWTKELCCCPYGGNKEECRLAFFVHESIWLELNSTCTAQHCS